MLTVRFRCIVDKIEQVRGNLNSLSVKIQSVDASLTNQILTRDATNITEEQMEEFKAS